MNDIVIEIDHLSKKFKDFVAVDDLSLKVHEGEIFGFLGPNGAGKSTTIRIMLSLIKATSGSVKFFGKDPLNGDRSVFANIGALVERPDFYNYLPAYRNLEFFAELSGVDTNKKMLYEMLDKVGLGGREKDKVKTYSLGMKQRLGIAQALVHDPGIIILDEPTNGLDPQGMKEVKDLLVSLAKDQGKTVFISSHILREIETMATSMAIINKGKTVIQGNVRELLNEADQNVTVEFNPDKKPDLSKLNGWSDKLFASNHHSLSFKTKKDSIPHLIDSLQEIGTDIYSVTPVNSLEDYFLKLTQGDSNV